ncbi:MAG: hypothetical protein ABIX01_05780 [Chitinophagaceae bacterium]
MPAAKDNIRFEKYAEINAESLLTELLINGCTSDQFIINQQSSFRKLYRKDVDKVSFNDSDAHTGRQVTIDINRDSIYDVLPEGLFHQPMNTNTGTDLSRMVGDSRRLKEEEKKARLFFKPFDQEMVGYATEVEQQERAMMQSILWGNVAEDPYIFWGIPGSIPKEPAAILSGIMPWAYLIKGDMKLTAKAMQMLMECRVSAKAVQLKMQEVKTGSMQMEEVILGQDSVIGNHFWEAGMSWVFTLHQIPPHKMALYTAKGYISKMLDFFTDIFLPIEIDVLFQYETQDSKAGEADPILGYGFTI